jgi:hypothetical protein
MEDLKAKWLVDSAITWDVHLLIYKISHMAAFPLKCYYCNEGDFGSLDGYDGHVVTRHPDLPGYPGPVDIELYKLKKQGMPWEREIKSDIDWK